METHLDIKLSVQQFSAGFKSFSWILFISKRSHAHVQYVGVKSKATEVMLRRNYIDFLLFLFYARF